MLDETILAKELSSVRLLNLGCSTNPVGEKSPIGFFICQKEKSEL